MRRRATLLLVAVGSILLLGSGVALAAANRIDCEKDRRCEGTARDDLMVGDNGRNLILGRGGDDTIKAGLRPDLLYGGDGNDKLFGQGEPDELFGGDGKDTLNGGEAFDRLLGNAGEDTLVGGEKADLLNGGPGDDRLTGGVSDGDTYLFEADWGQDTILGEPTSSGAGSENFLDFLTSADLTIDVPGGKATDGTNVVDFDPGIVLGIISGDGDDTIDISGDPAPGFGNSVFGGAGDDLIDISGDGAASSADHAICGDGNDTVVADAEDTADQQDCETVIRA